MAEDSMALSLLEFFAREIRGVVGTATIGQMNVRLEVDLETPMDSMNGESFQPVVVVVTDGETHREQAVAMDDTLARNDFLLPPPNTRWLAEAKEQIARWKRRIGRRLEALPPTQRLGLIPTDISFRPQPLDLARQTFVAGPPPPRPLAGTLGALAENSMASAQTIAPTRTDELFAIGVAGYRIRIGHAPNDADEWAGWIWLESDAHDGLVLYSNACERGDACTVDGDEPLYRLFASWLIGLLERRGFEQPSFPQNPPDRFPDIPLGRWLLFGDDDGPPLDHRIEAGAINQYSYAEILVPTLHDEVERMPQTRALYHEFIRSIIDPDARCGCSE